MKRLLLFRRTLAAALCLPWLLAAAPSPLPDASPEKLPRWRGFNLLEKFMLGNGRKPFVEADFQLISQWGFNFVRLPMDYRLWIRNGNWEDLDEATLKEIDQAVAWGGQYGIHVCINFHRAPGYTVASPPEARSLWTDPEAQRVCAKHWAAFARRYKGIPNSRVSFDLMNEPGTVDEAVYAAVVAKLVQAIRQEDPDRLIISDGLQWGTKPIPSLVPLRLAQATRGYTPMEISHYQASWVGGSDKYPRPAWPMPGSVNGTLLSPSKPEGATAIVLNGPYPVATCLRLHVGTVSTAARLLVEADGKTIWEKEFKTGPGEGEWKQAVFKPQWNIYQNVYDRDYQATIPAGAKQATIRVASGDWLSMTALGLTPAGQTKEDVLPMKDEWGKKVDPLRYAPGNAEGPFIGLQNRGRSYLVAQCVQPWKSLEAKGVGVMVGEWGAHNRTPHEVVLRWAEDSLKNWKDAGWGWALWNFRGSFGIMDSGRDDVPYENFNGHKLDRQFLELLQKY